MAIESSAGARNDAIIVHQIKVWGFGQQYFSNWLVNCINFLVSAKSRPSIRVFFSGTGFFSGEKWCHLWAYMDLQATWRKGPLNFWVFEFWIYVFRLRTSNQFYRKSISRIMCRFMWRTLIRPNQLWCSAIEFGIRRVAPQWGCGRIR